MLTTSTQVWGDRNLVDGGDLALRGRSRSSRVDPHVRVMAVDSARAAEAMPGCDVSAMLLARGETSHKRMFEWMHSEMQAYRASGMLHFQVPHIISHCGDAARVGKPAQELYFGTCWDHQNYVSYEFAPAVSNFWDPHPRHFQLSPL